MKNTRLTATEEITEVENIRENGGKCRVGKLDAIGTNKNKSFSFFVTTLGRVVYAQKIIDFYQIQIIFRGLRDYSVFIIHICVYIYIIYSCI